MPQSSPSRPAAESRQEPIVCWPAEDGPESAVRPTRVALLKADVRIRGRTHGSGEGGRHFRQTVLTCRVLLQTTCAMPIRARIAP
jgi:hypothetical protein